MKRTHKASGEPMADATGDHAPRKFDTEKVRLELIPPEFHWAVGQVLTFGAKKYAAGNWAAPKGFEWSRLVGAAERHIQAWKSGQDLDPESGLSHLAHASCMLAFLIASQTRGTGLDDRQQIGVRYDNRQKA